MVTRVRYVQDAWGHAGVVFDWEGFTVCHGDDFTKAALFELGLVYLGPEWARRVPPIDVTFGRTTTRLLGFTEAPAVWQVVDTFFRALREGTFRTGPA